MRVDTLTVTNVATAKTHEVLHLGCTAGVEPETFVLGRLVPVDVEPGLMFERRPLELDEQTAHDLVPNLLLGPMDWLCSLGVAIDAGRQPAMIGRAGSTPLWSDVRSEPAAQRS